MMALIRQTDKALKALFPDYYRRVYFQRWLKNIYHNTPYWADVRNAALRRDKYACQHCGRKGTTLQVHHLHYTYLFFEKRHMSSVTSLCVRCHKVADRQRRERLKGSFS